MMIEEAIKSYYGERCPDHDADCVVCQAWEQWDKITATKLGNFPKTNRRLKL